VIPVPEDIWRDSVKEVEHLITAAKHGDLERVNAILEANGRIVNERDDSGATALHYAALNGHRSVVQLLVHRGADINSTDTQCAATPAGWAIEYLREMGGYLAIELDDLAHAIRLGDARWAARFLKRFPSLRKATDTTGTPFQKLARESSNPDIAHLFESDDVL
jgi:Ankyrin repeats (3 copies)